MREMGEALTSMEALRLRGLVLQMLAEYAVSSFSDGKLFMPCDTLSNALGYPVDEINEACQMLAIGGLLESESPVQHTGIAWRVNMRAMEELIRGHQNLVVADIVARGWGLLR
jgi:hypothetical protein